METILDKPRLANLLDHFSVVEAPREQWRVAHPLGAVLLLVVCGTIASCDDFDDIAAWGEAHLGFLRRFLPYYHGVPGGRWLNILMNRIDPELFSACFMDWACTMRKDAPTLIALDGKTSRRSHDRATGKAALHLVSDNQPISACLPSLRAMSLSLLKFVGQASLVDDAMLPS